MGTRKGRKRERHILDRIEEERKTEPANKSQVLSVVFIPQTEHSELARRLRESEEEMLKMTGYTIKVVERLTSVGQMRCRVTSLMKVCVVMLMRKLVEVEKPV